MPHLVNARLVSKRVRTYDGLVSLHHHPGERGHQTGRLDDLPSVDAGERSIRNDWAPKGRVVVCLGAVSFWGETI